MAGVPHRKTTQLAARSILALALLVGPARSEARAAIAFVKNVGTSGSSTAGTILAVTVAAGGVPVGHTVIVTFAMDPAPGAVSCADARETCTARMRTSPTDRAPPGSGRSSSPPPSRP